MGESERSRFCRHPVAPLSICRLKLFLCSLRFFTQIHLLRRKKRNHLLTARREKKEQLSQNINSKSLRTNSFATITWQDYGGTRLRWVWTWPRDRLRFGFKIDEWSGSESRASHCKRKVVIPLSWLKGKQQLFEKKKLLEYLDGVLYEMEERKAEIQVIFRSVSK